MWKSVLAGTAALAIAGTSFVYAQQQQQPEQKPQVQRPHSHFRAHQRFSQDDMSAFADARIAALKAGLHLTPDQEKLWPALENALRDIAKSRLERRVARQGEPRPTDPVERLRREAEALTSAGTSLKRLAEAQAPLYNSLDDAQKHRFAALSHILSPRAARFAQRGREHGWRGHWRERQGSSEMSPEHERL
ncbi:MAG TPA: Spy/CpxP family protein refolding chaperone [Xanthobacteraceae bacterium]|nr:Spy/CpxP family protein refolding chaperone [Xanthobacteraceae bacterium]